MSDNKINERAIELFESQSPHQLAITAATAETKLASAMSALDRMIDQREQLAEQLREIKDVAGQVVRISDRRHEAWDNLKTLIDYID